MAVENLPELHQFALKWETVEYKLSLEDLKKKNTEPLCVPLFHASDVFLADGSRVSAATVASTAIAAAQWAVTQVTCLDK